MKKILFAIIVLLCVSCTKIETRFDDLYAKLDPMIEFLDKSRYNSYALFEDITYTSKREYAILPSGRLIVVKIMNAKSKAEYDILLKELEIRYSNKKCVNDIYHNNSETLTIDCRR